MSRVTHIGYFGRTQNVKDALIDAASVDAFAACIAALPRRKPTAEIVPLVTKDGAR